MLNGDTSTVVLAALGTMYFVIRLVIMSHVSSFPIKALALNDIN